MQLIELGYNKTLEKYRKENNLTGFEVGRVIIKHKNNFIVKTEKGEFDCLPTGKLIYDSKEDRPYVGDWVALSQNDEGKAVIHSIFPRHSVLSRQKVGISGQKQIIATNVDYGLIVFSVDRDFSINRMERYLTICHSSNVTPIVLLNKTDLIDERELQTLLEQINDRVKDIKILTISNETNHGLDKVHELLEKGKTYCLLGSSGVGKSTLINNLVGEYVMKTGDVSEYADRGKHVTTHREIIVLEKGIIMDNPGMRELGITEDASGLDATFDYIAQLTKQCKYKDCSHDGDHGCAIGKALKSGEIDEESYENFKKLQKENIHYNKNNLEKKKDGKKISKVIKDYKKQSKRGEY